MTRQQGTLNVEMPAALLGPPTGNGGGISSPRVLPWLRRICCIICDVFLEFFHLVKK
jgi:hypothetical protein